MENEYTPAPWYAVAYDGYYKLQDRGEYGNFDITNADYVGDYTAEANAKLASQAPILKELVEKQEKLINELIYMTYPEYRTHNELGKEIDALKSQLL